LSSARSPAGCCPPAASERPDHGLPDHPPAP
jgi:hypothetical protein